MYDSVAFFIQICSKVIQEKTLFNYNGPFILVNAVPVFCLGFCVFNNRIYIFFLRNASLNNAWTSGQTVLLIIIIIIIIIIK